MKILGSILWEWRRDQIRNDQMREFLHEENDECDGGSVVMWWCHIMYGCCM